jgi:riboflavin kinase / FMN adenylyltransferase
MKIVKDFSQISSSGYVVSFGNFDGVHLGHQKLLSEQMLMAQDMGVDLVLVSFNPHPKKILQPNAKSFLLCTPTEKYALLGSLGCKFLVEMAFTRDFSTLSAEHFLRHCVLTDNRLKGIFLGWDFAFGANKEGDADLVKAVCLSDEKFKEIKVVSFPPFQFDGIKVSSSYVRELLEDGRVAKASEMLGRKFSIAGHIVKGAGRGKIIGIPTANLSYDVDLIIPAKGVYKTTTNYKELIYKSVTNIGNNPTFQDNGLLSVETHILDFDQMIYGERLQVNFLDRIRDERKFSNVNDLVSQIKLDILKAKE